MTPQRKMSLSSNPLRYLTADKKENVKEFIDDSKKILVCTLINSDRKDYLT